MDSCAYILDPKDTASKNDEDTILAYGPVKIYKKAKDNRQIIDSEDVLFGQDETDIINSINKKKGLPPQLSYAYKFHHLSMICVTKNPIIIENIDECTLIEQAKKYGQLAVSRGLIARNNKITSSGRLDEVPYPVKLLYFGGADRLLKHGICEVTLENAYYHAAIKYNPEKAEKILKRRAKAKKTREKRKSNIVAFIDIYNLVEVKNSMQYRIKWDFFVHLSSTTYTEILFSGYGRTKKQYQKTILNMAKMMTAIFGRHSYRKIADFQTLVEKYKELNEKGIKKSKLIEEFKVFMDKEAKAKMPKDSIRISGKRLEPLKKINLSSEHIDSIIL